MLVSKLSDPFLPAPLPLLPGVCGFDLLETVKLVNSTRSFARFSCFSCRSFYGLILRYPPVTCSFFSKK